MSIALNARIDTMDMRLKAIEEEAKRVARELDRLTLEKAMERTDKKVNDGRRTA